MKARFHLLILSCLFLFALPSYACEVCAVYNSVESSLTRENDFQLGLAYQYQFSDSSTKPEELEFLQSQELQSNTWQLLGGYAITDTFSLQLSLPIIYREYRRIEDERNVSGTEKGLGDLAIQAKYIALREFGETWSYSWEVLGGLKVPTGDSDRLKEVQESELENRSLLRHGSGEGGNLIGGDDLALGSGSVDVLLGTAGLLRYRRFHSVLNVQYSIRTEGDYDYTYGNDLQFQSSTGYYLILEDETSLAGRVRFSGEFKDTDEFDGDKRSGSAETNLFLGPEFALTIDNDLYLSLAVDINVKNDDADNELASQYRIVSGILWRL